jgi:hypothetical protein
MRLLGVKIVVIFFVVVFMIILLALGFWRLVWVLNELIERSILDHGISPILFLLFHLWVLQDFGADHRGGQGIKVDVLIPRQSKIKGFVGSGPPS